MIVYILKSGLCLLVLFSFYKVFLENEQFHTIKRFYLIGSILLSIVIPFITFTYTVEIPETEYVSIISETSSGNSINTVNESLWKIYFPYLAVSIYISGLIFFGYRFAVNLDKMIKDIRSNGKVAESRYIFVLLGKKLDPYSFLNYIFLNSDKFRKQEIESPVIQHEKAHVDQRHSLDILLLEIIQVVFWFNPLFIWLKKSVRLNHEFLADRQVLSSQVDALEYSNILYNYSSGYHHNSLSSPINHSLIKKRIIMITKTFSKKRLFAKLGLFIPVLCICFYLFNNEIVAKTITVKSGTELLIKSDNNQSTQIALKTEKNLQDPLINLVIEGEKVMVNGGHVEVSEFTEHINKITEGLSKAQLMEATIQVKLSNTDEKFVKRLNNEFLNTKIYKATNRTLIPPPPPAPPLPPAVKGDIPPPPPPPSVEPKNHPDKENKRNLREKRLRDQARERQRMLEERSKFREERMTQIQEERLSVTQREQKLRELAREKERMERRVQRIKREQERLRNMETSAPLKQKANGEKIITEDIKEENGFRVKTTVIDNTGSAYPEDAIYFLNDKEIVRNEALKIINTGQALTVDIRKTKEGKDVVKIIHD